jgi:type I restriction enzyme R subunit
LRAGGAGAAAARNPDEAGRRGEEPGSNDDEVACHDALGTSDSAVAVPDDETLKTIAREPVATECKNVTINRTLHENVRARPRVLVIKRIPRKRGDPPDRQERPTRTVPEQAEMLSDA